MPGLTPIGAVLFVIVLALVAFAFFWIPAPFNIISLVAVLILGALFIGGYGIPRR